MKTLQLMRHAKSDWEANAATDHDRPLSQRGVRSAQLMGRLLTAAGIAPQLVISSTALRARTSAELAIEAGGWASRLELDPALYESGPDGVLRVAAGALDVDRLMLVGHQPTWSMLVGSLVGARVEMKTASIAGVDIAIDQWSQLTAARGTLSYLIHARMLFGTEWDRP